MRLVLHVTVILCGLFALNLEGCRSKPKRTAPPKTSVSIETMASPDAGVFSLNEAHFQARPAEIGEFSALRSRALAAIQAAANKNNSPNDSLVALAQALTDAPGSAVLAIELAKAAARARDQRRLNRYIQIAQPLVEGQPNLSKLLGSIAIDKPSKATSKNAKVTTAQYLGPRPAQKIADNTDLTSACSWVTKAFAEGRPPVDDVGQQGTASVDCQLLSKYALTSEIQAVPVVASVRGQGERLFAWVAAAYKGNLWLSASLTEISVPPFHPDGNGFAVELQRTAAYRGGLPELTAYLTERRSQFDVALNEQLTTDRHRIVVMTFDVEPPQTSAFIVLHSRTERSLVDPSDKVIPKGYQHSPDVGKVAEQTFKLEWGDNRVSLTETGRPNAKPIEQFLFQE